MVIRFGDTDCCCSVVIQNRDTAWGYRPVIQLSNTTTILWCLSVVWRFYESNFIVGSSPEHGHVTLLLVTPGDHIINCHPGREGGGDHLVCPHLG